MEDPFKLFGSVCVAVTTALVNATAVFVIKKKEQSGLNRCRPSANNAVNRINTMLKQINRGWLLRQHCDSARPASSPLALFRVKVHMCQKRIFILEFRQNSSNLVTRFWNLTVSQNTQVATRVLGGLCFEMCSHVLEPPYSPCHRFLPLHHGLLFSFLFSLFFFVSCFFSSFALTGTVSHPSRIIS